MFSLHRMVCVYRVEIFIYTPFSLLTKRKLRVNYIIPRMLRILLYYLKILGDLLSDNEIIKSKRPNGVLLFTAEYFPKAAYS
jgi:hypothetical protein